MYEFLEPVLDWILLYKLNIVLSTLIIILYLLLRKMAAPRIEEYVEQGHLKTAVSERANATLGLFSIVVSAAIILFIWGFDFKGLLTMSASLIAITGVALFASWSVLSNITAFFLLLANRSYRRGDFVRVINVDNYIEGYISEINLFNTKLISENREVIIYPNNLLVALPTVINPKDRYSVVGKTVEFSAMTSKEDI